MTLTSRERRAAWPLETFFNEDVIDGTFRDMLRSFFAGDSLLDRASEQMSHLMRVEEYVEDDTCVIRAELPGIDPEKDVEINVADGVMTLRAERKERSEEKRPDGFRSEFHYGSMARAIRLPEGATEADVKASYKDGILEVRVPAPKAAVKQSPTRIPISRD